jgi:GT2 family glycosyltransferase
MGLMNKEAIELAIIINSYNRLPLLKRSLTSLMKELEKSDLKYAIVLFDANSTDGSIEWIRSFMNDHENVHIKLMLASKQEPDSFSHGVNAACDDAIRNFVNLKNLFLYETDNSIASIEPLMRALKLLEENKDFAACGFTVKKYDGKSAGSGCSFPNILSFVLGQQLSFFLNLNKSRLKWEKTSYAEYSYSDVVYTSPLFIKKEVWTALKGFDADRFPFSDCDVDLAYRLRKEGKKMAILKTSSVIHDNMDRTSLWSSKRTINFYKARLAYFQKHKGKWINFLKPFLFITHLFELSVLFILLMLGKRNTHSLKTRLLLMKSVFVNYKTE